jgi:hypothetical protein
MGDTSHYKALWAVMIAMGFLSAAVFGQAAGSPLDDYEAGSNQNKFMGYSFFYDDSKDGGNSKVLSALPGTAGQLLFDATVSLGEGANGSKRSAKIDFKYGDKKPSCGPGCTYGQMVGFGTGFVAEGKVLDITGATSITFWAKASTAMSVRVEVATESVKDFAFHRSEPKITTSWTQYTVPLAEGPGFAQPAWSQTPVPFDPKKVQKIQFQVSVEDNLGLTQGTLFLDDIVVNGYKWIPPSACIKCVGAPGIGAGVLLADLDAAPKNQNKAGGYWYVYNDAEGRVVSGPTEYSEIIAGALPNATDPSKPTIAIAGAKGYLATEGAFIDFSLGPTYVAGGATIMPFVGLGTKLSDNLGTAFSNWTGSTGISFDYWTKAATDVEFLRLEAKANMDYGNAGIVHQTLLPATGGEWKSATVAWTDLKLPDWEEVKLIPDQTLKINMLDKIQWAFQGAPGNKGAFAIDNVKVMGLTAIPLIGGTGAVLPGTGTYVHGLRCELTRSGLDVRFAIPAGQGKARVELIDMRGMLRAYRAVKGHGAQTVRLDRPSGNAGVHAVRVIFPDGNRLVERIALLP